MDRSVRMFCAALAIAFNNAAAAPPIDLDAPGALARLQADRPQHFERVVRVLEDAQRLPEKDVIGWLRTNHQAEDAAFGPTLLVSFPPQRRLSFTLDAVAYRATVTVALPKPVAVPAR